MKKTMDRLSWIVAFVFYVVVCSPIYLLISLIAMFLAVNVVGVEYDYFHFFTSILTGFLITGIFVIKTRTI